MLKFNKKIIASKIVYCDSFIRQGTGLMFRTRSSVKDTAWVFRFKRQRKVAITMFFVFFPIDIVYLDVNSKIIELNKECAPFKNYISTNKIYTFIELASGTIEKFSLKKGMILKF